MTSRSSSRSNHRPTPRRPQPPVQDDCEQIEDVPAFSASLSQPPIPTLADYPIFSHLERDDLHQLQGRGTKIPLVLGIYSRLIVTDNFISLY
jgi:hypothetical protein